MMKLDPNETMLAQSYAAYMIAVSYFKSYKCVTPQMEQRTFMKYKLLGSENQDKMEKRIIALMEKQVLPHISEEFLGNRVEASFFRDGGGVRITDSFEVLEIRQSLREIDLGKKEKRTEIVINTQIFDAEEEE